MKNSAISPNLSLISEKLRNHIDYNYSNYAITYKCEDTIFWGKDLLHPHHLFAINDVDSGALGSLDLLARKVVDGR